MIRAFLAIRPPEEVCEALEELQADLPAGRPVAFENLHMTLVFLGEHPAPALEDLAGDLAAIKAERFALSLEGVGVFGGARPRSVHVGAPPTPALTRLRGKIQRAAERLGMGDPKRFTPHVTLARFRGTEGRAEAVRGWLAANAGFREGPFEVEAFALVRSTQTRSGPIYTEMARFPLAA